MKGLILKDLYMVKSYFRMYLFILAAFIALPIFSADNAFFLFYPVILAGSIPFSLIAYDERSKWNQYCGTLPVSRKAIVSARYVVALGFFLAVFLLIALLQPISPVFSAETYVETLSLLVVMGLLTPTVLLPLTFRFGVEKGRLFYYFIIGAFCALSVGAANIHELSSKISHVPVLILPAVSIVFFILSWLISIKICEKKEF